MPAWLIPALKAVLPHVGTIISAAGPVFTKKSLDAAANQSALLQKQIGELQSAASQNAANIKELAAQLEKTIAALEHVAAGAEASLRRTRRFALAALALGAGALGLALVMFFSR